MGSVGELCFNACNGTANVVPAGGDGSYTYAWTTTPVQTASTAANLCPGTYDVTVTDGQLCSATSSIVVDPAIGFFRRSSDVKNKLPYTKINSGHLPFTK